MSDGQPGARLSLDMEPKCGLARLWRLRSLLVCAGPSTAGDQRGSGAGGQGGTGPGPPLARVSEVR